MTLGRVARLPFGLALVIATLVLAPAAKAAPAAPAWSVGSTASPTHLVPGDSTGANYYTVVLTNSGGAATDGSPITITDTLPAGIEVDTDPNGHALDFEALDDRGDRFPCEIVPAARCIVAETLFPGQRIVVFLPLVVAPDAPATVTNRVTVAGGGAPDASTTETTPVSATPASGGFQTLDSSITDAAGSPVSQAGSHPYRFAIGLQLNTVHHSGLSPPAAAPRDLRIHLPPGLVVNPTAADHCTEAQLERHDCPDTAQVGLVHPKIDAGGLPNPASTSELYNMVPPPGRSGEFAFDAGHLGIFIHLLGGLDSAGDGAISSEALNLLQFSSISGISIEFWGSPSDPGHDRSRGECLGSSSACPVPAAGAPFLTMPTACADQLPTRITVVPWEDPANPFSASAPAVDSSGDPVGVTGCDAIGFEPTLRVQPTTSVADAPSGLSVDLGMGQTDSLDQLAAADLRKATLALPEGLVINPSGAIGLGACSSSEIGLSTRIGEAPLRFSAGSPRCPDAAKIGTAQIETPLLDDPLPGTIYIAAPYDNPFGSLLAVYVVVDDAATGIVLRLAGRVEPDPGTGRLIATFDESPQLPISRFRLSFFGGSRGILRTPALCGAYSTTSALTSWSAPPSGPPASPHDEFSIDHVPGRPCAGAETERPATPSNFDAGTVEPIAGAHSPFVLTLQRDDGAAELGSISLTAPPGLLADIAGVGTCSEPEGRFCPAGSRVGRVTVGVGAGPQQLYLDGAVYLGGPYRGAPLSLAIVVPALSGPFDLGDLLVRVAVYVDPDTAQLRLVSDSFPTIVAGIPTDLRSINLSIDRSGFIRNPTSCDPTAITATANAVGGQASGLSERFQVAGCSSLPFRPRLGLSLSTGARNAHPALRAVLRGRPGEAGIETAGFALPPAELLDFHHLRALCNRDLAAEQCPTASRLGTARFSSPILEAPLVGPIYLREPVKGLPDLLAEVQGWGVRLTLHGHIASPGGRVRLRLDRLPDVPLGKAVLSLPGGKRGILVNSRDLCAQPRHATAVLSAHNGRQRALRPRLMACR